MHEVNRVRRRSDLERTFLNLEFDLQHESSSEEGADES